MPPIRRRALWPVPAAALLALCAVGAAANPQGGVVQAGSARIAPNGNRLDVIQSSQRAVIDWRSFSIDPNGHVNFQQPSTGAATLNRVTGPEMSAILGRLTANGTVFLVNPNGILIGPGAKIDVGGLVAATANITNENFMAGRYKFDEVVNRNAVIVNRGEITAQAGGLVALVAPGVENSGVIRAELGRVVLASGNRFTLDLFGDKLIAFAVDDKVAARLTDADGRPLKAYVNQAGRIEADGGSVLITASAAKAVLDNVINLSGVVQARSFVQRPGEIVLNGGDEGLVRVAGTLDASGRAGGASGGSVKVLGAEVVLDAASRIDAAGDAGGGAVFVGGGLQGGGGVPRSSHTTIEAGATVNADALTRGDGGTIVAWSDGETRFAGALSARGGAQGGDGGFVEVSGKHELAFAGAIDVAAPAGKGGRLLLDPEFLAVDTATAWAVSSVLRSGSSVALTAGDTIDVRNPIDGRGGAAGGGLSLTVGNAILVNGDIVTNEGPVTLRAGAGGIAMAGGTLVHAGAAPIALAATGDVAVEHLVTTGVVSITAERGIASLNRDLGGSLGAGLGALSVSAGRGVYLNGVRSAGAVRIATLGPGATITLAGPIAAGGAVVVGNPGLVSDTTIRLEDSIRTMASDIELHGRTLVNPRLGPGNVVTTKDAPLLTLADRKLYENPIVQVSLQTTGGGSIRLNGDVLWDYTRPPLNSLHYLYGLSEPYLNFPRTTPGAVAPLRAAEPERSIGYYGLNLAVEKGGVTFGGNLGTYDAAGVSKLRAAPTGTLGASNDGNGLFVTLVTGAPLSTVSFAPTAKVQVSLFRVVPLSAPAASRDLRVASEFGARPQSFSATPNLPAVQVAGGGPTLIGPGPNNVAAPRGLAAVGPLPDVPFAASPAGQVIEAASRAGQGASGTARNEAVGDVDPMRGTDLGRARPDGGAGRDVFGNAAPLAPTTSKVPAADAEYFSQEPFEFVQTRSRRAGE